MHPITNRLLYFSSIGVAGYAIFAYLFIPLGNIVHPDMKVNFMQNYIGIYSHIFASAVALVIGPFQFSQRIRQKHTNVHRWLGRIYVFVGVLIGGVAGLYMAQFAFGGIMSKLGFALLALVWLYTGFRAYVAIRKRDFVKHQQWMIRNFSLTFAAVTLRIYLPTSMALGADFTLAYTIIAWLCWVPNLIFAEWLIKKRF